MWPSRSIFATLNLGMTKNRYLLIIKLLIGILCLMILAMAFHHRRVFSEDCHGLQDWKVEKVATIADPDIKESSGLYYVHKDLFWTHNDDDDHHLYLINLKGETVLKWRVWIQNNDWEEITGSKEGNLFVGNFGNNFNLREKVSIWKLDPFERKNLYPIIIHYADRPEFAPPIPWLRSFDCEAMVHYGDSLYLFTKNKHERSFHVYPIADKVGHCEPKPRQEIPILGMVTGACLSPNQEELAILTYQRIYLFHVGAGFKLSNQPHSCIPIANGRQMEAISWFKPDSILVSNEQRDLFLISKKK